MTELTDIREAFARGESAALDSGWLCNDLLREYIEENPGLAPRTALSECITFLHDELRTEGIARPTIADRINVTDYWTRERVKCLPVKFGYHHLRAILGKTDKDTQERLNKVLNYIRENEVYPKVEEVSDIVNGREAIPIYEKRRMAFVKQARKIYATDPDAQWRAAAELIIARDAADGGTWDSDK
jgi:hypothetical protein